MAKILTQLYHLKSLLSNDKVDSVISGIKQIGDDEKINWIQNEITLISAKYQNHCRNHRLGLLNNEESQVELAKIRASIISLMSEIERHEVVDSSDEYEKKSDSYHKVFNEYNSINSINKLNSFEEKIKENDDLTESEVLKLSSLLTETINILQPNFAGKSSMSIEEKKTIKKFIFVRSASFIGIIAISTVVYFVTGSIIFALILGFLMGALFSQFSSD